MIPIMIEQRIMSLDDCTWLYTALFYSCLDLSVLVSWSQTTKLCCPIHSLTRSGFFVKRELDSKWREIQIIWSVLVTRSQTTILPLPNTTSLFVVLFFSSKRNGTQKLFPTPDRWMARLLPTTQHSTGPLTTSLWGCWGHTVVWNGKNPPEIGSL